MPEIEMKIKSAVLEKFTEAGLKVMGDALTSDIINTFGSCVEHDIVFNVDSRHFTTGEDVQAKILFTVGKDEYDQGSPFDPAENQIEELLARAKRTLGKLLSGITESSFLWVIPVRYSAFSGVYVYPKDIQK